ncbi:MAG TPA: tetratricopeptide repeat protein [Tepidisphaeraceae bacterium]|nr:tetratricopeptide repeat protein [Tepidisphaeraceae bacterium]
MTALPSAADVLYLKDGTKIEGDIKHSDNGWLVYRNGKSTLVFPEQVKSIELSASPDAAPKAAAERLASLRRSVETLNDPRDVIARYQHFIEQVKDPAAVAEAKRDMASWQDRADQNMVKVGSKWILPGERAKLSDEAMGLAEQARQLMKQGRAKEAEPLLVEATADDPQNVSALYLTALLRYQQDQLPAARKALDAVAQLVPNHAPTLNNLGVVQWRQRQYVAALISFDGAMLAAPVNKDILDNVASALQALPAEFRNSNVTQRVARRFQEQDRQLAEQMAQAGWHRVGTGWVTDKDYDELKKQEKETQDKLDALAGEFDKAKQHLADLDTRIADTEEQINRIDATSYVRDPASGTFLRIPYPDVYYRLQKDDARLKQERQTEVAHMDDMRETAKGLKQRQVIGKTVEVQRMIGPEGTPIREIETLSTRPATHPAETQE